MFRFRSKASQDNGGTAVAEQPRERFSGDEGQLQAELDRLIERNRVARSTEVERDILALSNLIGVKRLEARPSGAVHPEPETDRLPAGDPLPEFTRDQVTPGLLRAGILRDGCLLVRGLIPRDAALGFAKQIDRAFIERDRHDEGQPHDSAYYTEIDPDPRFGNELPRAWIKMGGGVLAVDSPMLFFEMRRLFADARLDELVSGYLGEPGLITGQKTTLRKATPDVPGAWHQDGKFMGQVRALNMWLSLSRCGDEAPGLDIVPKRFDDFLTTQTDEALLDYAASQRVVEEAAGDAGIIRPIFEPGDALFFDDLFMHKTGSDPSMPNPRYAIENWFFGPSAFPTEYAPFTV
jgi:hypothetical protein